MCVFLSRVLFAIRFCSSEEKLIEWDNENYYNEDYIYDLNFRNHIKGKYQFWGISKESVGGWRWMVLYILSESCGYCGVNFIRKVLTIAVIWWENFMQFLTTAEISFNDFFFVCNKIFNKICYQNLIFSLIK